MRPFHAVTRPSRVGSSKTDLLVIHFLHNTAGPKHRQRHKPPAVIRMRTING